MFETLKDDYEDFRDAFRDEAEAVASNLYAEGYEVISIGVEPLDSFTSDELEESVLLPQAAKGLEKRLDLDEPRKEVIAAVLEGHYEENSANVAHVNFQCVDQDIPMVAHIRPVSVSTDLGQTEYDVKVSARGFGDLENLSDGAREEIGNALNPLAVEAVAEYNDGRRITI
jgi:hypothetical protein